MPVIEYALLAWTGAALIWWLIAYRLLGESPDPSPATTAAPLPSLTIFKPLPPTTADADRLLLAAAIESFIAQLDANSQMLVGVEQVEADAWEPVFQRWRRGPAVARILIRTLPPPLPEANPKIAKLEALAPMALGQFWLWSDADIIAPPGLLKQLQRELADSGAGGVTSAYAVRSPARAAGMLDALFVNLEFLPGALLLGRRGRLDFAFGAATLFCAADFHAHVSWSELRRALADDHELGKRLGSVRLSGCVVETLALSAGWRQALNHYYRWQKTIRWCRPGGYAALLAILPFLGWLAAALARPSAGLSWAGLGGTWLAESVFAGIAFRRLNCALPRKGWLAFIAWPPLRALTWLAVWMPLPIRWGEGHALWRQPRRAFAKSPSVEACAQTITAPATAGAAAGRERTQSPPDSDGRTPCDPPAWS